MTLPEALSRLAAAGRIRSAWLPGMSDTSGNVYQWRHENRQVEACAENSEGAAQWTEPGADDPSNDPATTGCLLALLREAMRDPSVYLAPNAESMIRPDGTSPLWFAYTGRGKGPIGVGPTEYAAVVAALDAAAERLEPTP